MAPYEHLDTKELNPAREFERHMAGLTAMQHEINGRRVRAQLGHAGMPEHSGLAMQDRHGRHQFANVARDYADTLDARQEPEAKMYADILAVVPNTIGALHALQHRDEYETKDYHAAIHMIEFNHVLREIVEANPSIQPKTVTDLIRSTALRYGYGQDVAYELTEETQTALYGMKHEKAFEAALYYLPEGYEIIEPETEEDETELDKHGTDFRVRCPNGVVIYIDVKSSPEALRRAKTKQNVYRRRGGKIKRNKLMLYSGFTSEDFEPGNPWQPTRAAIERVCPQIEEKLRQASGYRGAPVKAATAA